MSSCLVHTGALQLSIHLCGGVAAVRVLIVAVHNRLGGAAAICEVVRKSQAYRNTGRIQGQVWESPSDRVGTQDSLSLGAGVLLLHLVSCGSSLNPDTYHYKLLCGSLPDLQACVHPILCAFLHFYWGITLHP